MWTANVETTSLMTRRHIWDPDEQCKIATFLEYNNFTSSLLQLDRVGLQLRDDNENCDVVCRPSIVME